MFYRVNAGRNGLYRQTVRILQNYSSIQSNKRE